VGSPEVGGADTRFVVLSVLFFITTTRFEVEDLRLREPETGLVGLGADFGVVLVLLATCLGVLLLEEVELEDGDS